jgi:hypothetical protein
MSQPDEPEAEAVPRITGNSLTPSALWSAQLTTGRLTAASAAAMGPSKDARKVLSYAVGCALNSAQSISFSVDGAAFSNPGTVGVAQAWPTRALTASEAAWVSACVFARVNLASQPISVSVVGTTTALSPTASERADYAIEEGAFWGNAFVDLGAVEPYSCNGVDQAANDTYGDLPDRQCAQPDSPGSQVSPCGMHYAGLCTAVCKTQSPYANCAFPGTTAVAEVVTAFLHGQPQ